MNAQHLLPVVTVAAALAAILGACGGEPGGQPPQVAPSSETEPPQRPVDHPRHDVHRQETPADAYDAGALSDPQHQKPPSLPAD